MPLKFQLRSLASNGSDDSSSASQGWCRTKEDQYYRPYDEFESLFSLFCRYPDHPDIRSLDVLMGFRIETDKTPSQIAAMARAAWVRMRYLHPSLAMTTDSTGYTYHVPQNDQAIDEWADRTLIIRHTDSNINDTDIQNFGVVSGREQATLYYFSKDKQWFLRASHLITDGQGIFIAAHDFLTEMAKVESGDDTSKIAFGEEIKLLPRSFFNIQQSNSPPSPWSLPDFQKQPNGDAVAIPYSNAGARPGPGSAQVRVFSERSTKNIFNSLKKTGPGLTPYLHAAVIQAGKEMTPSSPKQHSTNILCNLRDLCQNSPPNATSRATTLRLGLWPIQIQVDDQISHTATTLKDAYTQVSRGKPDVAANMVSCNQKVESVLGKYHPYRGIMPSFIGDLSRTLSSTYGTFKLCDAWGIGIPFDEKIYIGIQTFGGRLSIRAVYNETYYAHNTVAEYLEKIEQKIQTAMMEVQSGIDLPAKQKL